MEDGATLLWILAMGLVMAAIALVGAVTLVLPEPTLKRLLKPLVAFAAGSLVGGALFHMLPHAVHASGGESLAPWLWTAVGFTLFLALDQLMEWHHCHLPPSEHTAPPNALILTADALHNLLGGIAVGAVFVADVRAGLVAWTAAALHEVPQELGDFGILVHGGWPPRRALLWNFASALTFPLGGLLAWLIGGNIDVSFLVAIGAGSFLYIGAADLVPAVKRACTFATTSGRFVAFVLGVALLYAAAAL
ncbi:MAG: zinc transporter [Deltaproteobacteria bacterium HGW-Deltaproteobacteria-14]|jgi:zinc and cadmium transporter|nr:MAG: zinc transporter [Deltaproteobacteria bacterium HGW-Deltaproteobacteria-14]